MTDHPTLDQSNAAMRARSGHVRDDRPLVSFLYLLLRDHVVAGAIEEMMLELDAQPDATVVEYTNGWLAEYAQDIADRLGHGPTGTLPAGAAVPPRTEDHTVASDEPHRIGHAGDGNMFEYEHVDFDGRVLVRQGAAGPKVPPMMCRTCRAGNPDCRRALAADGYVQVCWSCRTPLPELPPDAPADLPASADPAKGETPCGATDPSGRLVCMLPDTHRAHGDPVTEDDVAVKQLCGEPDPHLEGQVCGKPRGHERHGAEGTL